MRADSASQLRAIRRLPPSSSAMAVRSRRQSMGSPLAFVHVTSDAVRNEGRLRRSSISRRVNSSSSPSADGQSNHVSSLSWQWAWLLPSCVRPISSPPHTIGTPSATSSVVSRLRTCRARNSTISGSSVGPSTPQFHEQLSLAPSRLSSPLASLCRSLYDTRSRRVNPSWVVTTFTLVSRVPKRSTDPPSRADSDSVGAPRQRSLTTSWNDALT